MQVATLTLANLFKGGGEISKKSMSLPLPPPPPLGTIFPLPFSSILYIPTIDTEIDMPFAYCFNLSRQEQNDHFMVWYAICIFPRIKR